MPITERSALRSLSVEIDGSTEPYLRVGQLAPSLNVKPRTITEWANRFPDFPRLSLPGSIRISSLGSHRLAERSTKILVILP
jgi:hypothetical protein